VYGVPETFFIDRAGRIRFKQVGGVTDALFKERVERLLAEATPEFDRPEIPENALLAINYTSGTTSKPKGVMITHRNAWVNAVGMMVHHPMSCAERYLWTLPMFHANGWTYVWIVTAVGGTHVCLRKVDTHMVYRLLEDERVTMLCAAPTVLIAIASAPEELRATAPRGVRVVTAGAAPAAHTIERIEEKPAEPVVYMLDHFVIGGFYRVHGARASDENLNAPGMHFVPLAFEASCTVPDPHANCDAPPNRFYAYGVVARLALAAAALELEQTAPGA